MHARDLHTTPTECKQKTTVEPSHPIIWKRLKEWNLLNLGSGCYFCFFFQAFCCEVFFSTVERCTFGCLRCSWISSHKWEELNRDENIPPGRLNWTSNSQLHVNVTCDKLCLKCSDSRIRHAARVYGSATPTHVNIWPLQSSFTFSKLCSLCIIILRANPWFLLLMQGPYPD